MIKLVNHLQKHPASKPSPPGHRRALAPTPRLSAGRSLDRVRHQRVGSTPGAGTSGGALAVEGAVEAGLQVKLLLDPIFRALDLSGKRHVDPR